MALAQYERVINVSQSPYVLRHKKVTVSYVFNLKTAGTAFLTAVLVGSLDKKRKPVNIPNLAMGFAVVATTTVGVEKSF